MSRNDGIARQDLDDGISPLPTAAHESTHYIQAAREHAVMHHERGVSTLAGSCKVYTLGQ